MTRLGRAFGWILAIVGVVGAAATLQARDRWFPRTTTPERVLYLTDGRLADTLALSFDSVMADVYWIRTIQHYGRDRRSLSFSGRFTLLDPLVNLTTSLDPYFTIAYQFGALFLAEPQPNGAGRLDQGLALLEKGLRVEPDRWQYAQYLGFLHYWYGHDRLSAAREFTRAAAMPGAPIWLKPLAANMMAEGGDREAARALWQDLARAQETWIRELAERRLRALDQPDPEGRR